MTYQTVFESRRGGGLNACRRRPPPVEATTAHVQANVRTLFRATRLTLPAAANAADPRGAGERWCDRTTAHACFRLTAIDPGVVLLSDFSEPVDLSQCRPARDSGGAPRPIAEIVHGTRAVTAVTALRLSESSWRRAPRGVYRLRATGDVVGQPAYRVRLERHASLPASGYVIGYQPAHWRGCPARFVAALARGGRSADGMPCDRRERVMTRRLVLPVHTPDAVAQPDRLSRLMGPRARTIVVRARNAGVERSLQHRRVGTRHRRRARRVAVRAVRPGSGIGLRWTARRSTAGAATGGYHLGRSRCCVHADPHRLAHAQLPALPTGDDRVVVATRRRARSRPHRTDLVSGATREGFDGSCGTLWPAYHASERPCGPPQRDGTLCPSLLPCSHPRVMVPRPPTAD